MTLPRSFRAFVAAALVVAPLPALAQTPDPAREEPAEVEEPPEPGAGTPRAYAPDWRKGAFLLSLGGSYVVPLGSIASGVTASDLVSGGPGVSLGLGFGLSRHVSFELDGSYGMLGGGAACAGCSGSTLGVGMRLVYHLAQGIAFDPWASYGVGFRTSLIEAPETGAAPAFGIGRSQGIDFARITLGGTFYPHPVFGFGPFLEGTVGSYRLRPDAGTSPSVYGFFQVGLRVTFDPLRGGKVRTPATVAAAF
ncbi:hypothetical protein [Polyangium fumosum]|uniref:Outer membrane protein beta-barrel domain-containing protein n=1 Tax=Polyangium fumosum TaxID=889272 RepID=A0A4U1JC89_9BACT|nr:hypothetical protein [Polyangium fumosum]TKD07896.1 hypothetical protein E8A74_16535 [Polyangium fumosum]